MIADSDPCHTEDHFALRKQVLVYLYGLFREVPYAAVELEQIATACGTTARELNWNLVYLERCGYVEMSRSGESHPYVACSVALTASGIDLIENGPEFRKRFPGGDTPDRGAYGVGRNCPP